MTTRHASSGGAFELTSLPGQSQVAVCHGFFISPAYRGKGSGQALKAIQLEMLAYYHYDYALATVAASNLPQQAILAAKGFTKPAEFNNRRQAEVTQIWGRPVIAGEAA